MADELKPCPFCGKRARYERTKGYAFVKCGNLFCAAVGPMVVISDTYIAKEKAIKYWNRRCSDG
jgi:hypothetical protein